MSRLFLMEYEGKAWETTPQLRFEKSEDGKYVLQQCFILHEKKKKDLGGKNLTMRWFDVREKHESETD